MNHNSNNIESRLWDAADELRANSKLKSSEYSVPVLGLVFLCYADHKSSRRRRRNWRGLAADGVRSARRTTRRGECSTCPRRRASRH